MFLLCFHTGVAQASSFSSELNLASRFFLEDTPSTQKDYSSNFRPELKISYDTAFGRHWDFLFSGSMTYDEYDYNRRRGDVDELFFRYSIGDADLSMGIVTEFWGVVESRHLVNIINQRNIADNIDEESTLGQPAVKLQSHLDWGSVQMFWMPWFRERVYPDIGGRPSTELKISDTTARYESGAEKNHHDFALRYAHTFGKWDVGLGLFLGTEREPVLVPEVMPGGAVELVPFYRQIRQPSLDLQYTTSGLLLKLEGVYRDYSLDEATDGHALVIGFEYTQGGLLGSSIDVGYLVEYLYDKQGESVTPFSDDIFLAFRTAFNNVAQSVALAGVYVDRERQSLAWRVEVETRLRDGLTLELEGQTFENQKSDSLLYDFRKDDYIEVGLTWYF